MLYYILLKRAITKKLYIRLVYLNPWIFISNKNNNIKTFLLIFLLFCILYIFFHVVGHTTTVFCPQPFQKNSPYYRRDLCLGQMSNLHYLLIKVTWEILWYTTKMYFDSSKNLKKSNLRTISLNGGHCRRVLAFILASISIEISNCYHVSAKLIRPTAASSPRVVFDATCKRVRTQRSASSFNSLCN